MSKSCPVAIEACAAWPEGIYPVAQIAGDTHHVRAFVVLTKRSVPVTIFPARFDPVGAIERGAMDTVQGVTCERFDGVPFCRAWLDLVRVAFPEARWCTGQAEVDPGLTAAYACLRGRVVGIVAQMREAAP